MSTQSSHAAGTPSVVLPSACILPPSPPPSALSSSSSSSISSSVPACVSYSPSSSSLTYSSSMLTVDIVLNELGALDHSFNDSTSSGSTTTTSGSSSPGSPNGSFMLDFDSPTPTPSPTSSSSSSAASGSSSSITSSSSSLSSSSGQLVSSPPPPSDESAPATPFSESDDISVPTSPGGTPLHASLPFKKAKTPRVPLTAIATLGKTLIQGDSLEKTSVFSFLEQLGQSGTNFDKYKDKIKKKPSAGTKRKKGKSSRHGKKARGERKSKKSRKSKQPKDSTTADGSDDKENTPAVSASSSSAPSSSASSSSASSSSVSASAPNAAALHQQKQQQLSHQQHNHLVDNNANHNGGHRHAHHRHHHKDETGKKAASPPRSSSSSSSSSASALNRPYHAAAPSKPTTSRPKSPRRKPAPQHNPSPGGRVPAFFEHSTEEMMMVSPRGSREHGDVLSQHRGSMLPAPPFGRHPDPRRMQPQLPFPLLPSPVPQQPPHLAHLSHPQHHNHQASPPHLHFGGGASGAFPAFSAPQSSGGGGGMLPGLPLPWPVPQTSGSHPFLLPSTPPTSSVAGDQQSGGGGGGHQQHHQQGQQHQHQHQHQHPHQHQHQQNNQLAGFDISSIFAASAGGNYDSSEAIDLSSLLNDAADVVGEKGETAMSGDGIPFQWAMSHPHNQQEEFLLEMSEMLAGGAGGWPAGAQQQHSDQGQHQDQHHDVGNAGPHGQMLVSDINLWFS